LAGVGNGAVQDIVEFLGHHEPFDALSEEGLEGLARAVEVEFFAAGATILSQGEGPIGHLWVVRRGAVELVDRGRVLDVLGEGELFGHRWMLADMPVGVEARASEDTLCYRIPAEAAVELLARPAGVRFVVRSMLARPLPDATRGPALDPAQKPVAQLVNGHPIIADPDWTVRQAAQRMVDANVSAVLVRLADGRLGILTDSDLRARVVAGGVAADAPVTEAMSAPAFTVTPERFGAEVMLEISRPTRARRSG
jgi:CBS domain-containing protein